MRTRSCDQIMLHKQHIRPQCTFKCTSKLYAHRYIACSGSKCQQQQTHATAGHSALAHTLCQQLSQQLCMPQDTAQQLASAVLPATADQCELDLCADNINLLAHLFPRSSMRRVEKLLVRNPALLLAPLRSWKEFLSAYGVSQQAFCGILLWQTGAVINQSTPHQAGTVILVLQSWGLSCSDINRSVLWRAPQVLLLQPQQLQELYSFLTGATGTNLPASRVRDLVAAAPQVLLQDVATVLQPRLDFLRQELGADAAQVSSLLHRSPGLLLADSTTAIQPKLQQLRHHMGFESPELLQLVCADPTVLSLSSSSLQCKWEYLTQQMGLGKREVLTQCPAYFSKTLITEVGPRHSYVVQRGLQARIAADGPVPLRDSAGVVQQQQRQLQPPTPHLGRLLDPSIPEFLAALGQEGPDAAAVYQAHAEQWAATEGLRWTGVRVTT